MKWFIGILGVIVFIILLVVLVFRRPNQPARPADQPVSTVASTSLTNLSNTSAELRYTVQGKIVSEEEHRSLRVTVSRTLRRLEVLQGYDEVVVASTDLNNTDASFATFLAALEQVGYSKVRESAISDERGVCPEGRRYIFEISGSGQGEQRTWTSSCSSSAGTFAGNRSSVEQLFKGQIPGYNKLVSGVKL